MTTECINCKDEMNRTTCYDDGGGSKKSPIYAWNLSVCSGCGAICKEDAWANKGKIWVLPDNSVKRESI